MFTRLQAASPLTGVPPPQPGTP